MPRIRWPLGSVPNTNAGAAAKETQDDNPQAENPPARTSKKRRSGDGVSTSPPSADTVADQTTLDKPPAKKPKRTLTTTKQTKSTPVNAKENNPTPPTTKQAKEALKSAAADLLDVSTIIQLDPDEEAPIYDTCDTIRRKIRAFLAKDGITQAAFLRAIVTAAYGEASTKKIQATSLNGFMKQKGPLAGNTSCVYYAAYVFFEKLRIKQGKGKTEDREIIEDVWPGGVDTKVQSGKVSYVGLVNTRLGMDKYGKVRVI